MTDEVYWPARSPGSLAMPHERDRLPVPDIVAVWPGGPVDGVLQNSGHR